jgi:hypothetical protein
VEPLDRLRSAHRGGAFSPEALAQRLAERVTDLVVHAIDINALLQTVDLNALLERVDVNAPLKQVDLNELIQQVDVNELLKQVDVSAVLDRVDINDVIGRIDMERLVSQTDIGAIIARSTGGIATEALDAARSGAVGLDQLIDRWVTRRLRRKAPRPLAPPALLNAQAQPAGDRAVGAT